MQISNASRICNPTLFKLIFQEYFRVQQEGEPRSSLFRVKLSCSFFSAFAVKRTLHKGTTILTESEQAERRHSCWAEFHHMDGFHHLHHFECLMED